MELIIKESGNALYQNGDELHFIHYDTDRTYVIAFVLGLISVICLVNGLVWLFMNWQVAVPMFIVSGIVLLAWRFIKNKRKRLESNPISAANTVLIINKEDKEAFTGKRIHLGHLKDCRFYYRFRLGSSSKRLVFKHPNGKIDVANGNPFRFVLKPFYKELWNEGLV